MMLARSAAVGMSAAFLAAISSPCLAKETTSADCASGEPRLLIEFEGAGAEDCIRTEDGFAVTIVPETVPVNRSPWYAFDIVSARGGEVTVRLDYAFGEHRYIPKIVPIGMQRHTGNHEVSVSVSESGNTATLTLGLLPGRYRVSAQPVIRAFEHREWALHFAAATPFEFEVAGRSQQGRDIWQLTSANTDSRMLVLLLGGQHPPEVPGVFAMRAFLDRIGMDDELAMQFRSRFRIAAFPFLNPDGAAHGFWRSTAGLSDLNRDWGIWSQRESAIVGNYLEAERSGGVRPVFMIDFHATRAGDVLYIPSSDAAGVEPFLSAWIGRIETAMGDTHSFEPITGNNPGLSTSRSWFTRTFERPGVTLEIHDETDTGRIRALATVAAEAMMLQLLEEYCEMEKAE